MLVDFSRFTLFSADFSWVRGLFQAISGLDADKQGVGDDQEARDGLEAAALHQLRQPRARILREIRLRAPQNGMKHRLEAKCRGQEKVCEVSL